MLAVITDSLKKKINFLAYYQIVGGIIGFVLTLWLLTSLSFNILTLMVLLVTIGLYIFSIYCGKVLIDRRIKRGLELSITNQALQAISFYYAGFSLRYVAGVNLSLGIDITNDLKFVYEYSLSCFDVFIHS
jgi:hypothetical protein